VRIGVEEDVTLYAGGRGDFEVEGVFAADLKRGGKTNTHLVLLGVDEVRIVVLAGGFQLRAFGAEEAWRFRRFASGAGGLPL